MAENDRFTIAQTRAGAEATAVEYDEGLRSYMLRIYNYMGLGVALSGVVAYALGSLMLQNPALAQAIYGSPLRWVIMLAPLAFLLVLSFGIHRLSTPMASALFWTYAATTGLSISWIMLVFTGQSIVSTFLITAIAFGALSLWGYTTKKDLSAWGTFFFIGLVGVFLAIVVNLFLQSSALHFAICVIGILVFAGLTAYDNQRLKNEYLMMAGTSEGEAYLGKAAIMGALSLYLNFINMFLMMLQLFGNQE